MDMTGPLTDMIIHGIANSDKTGVLTDAAIKHLTETFAVNLVQALPIIAVVGICVYACCSIFSKKVAKIGVISVIIYGVIIVL